MANIMDRADAVRGPQIEGLVRRWPVFSIWLAACALLGACRGFGVSPNGDFDDLMKFQKICLHRPPAFRWKAHT
jgi:hypothetical protein